MMPSRRRYPRMPLNLDWGKAQPLLGAQAHWPNHETVAVFDLSYSGASVGRPALLKPAVGEVVSLGLSLTGTGPITNTTVLGKVVWLGEQSLGLEFVELKLDARLAIDQFLVDRMIGFSMRRVDRRLYAEAEDFTDWYHGPQNTNVFLWIDLLRDELKRARVEFDEQVLEFAEGALRSPPGEEGDALCRRALLVLSQISQPPRALKILIEELAKKW